VLRISAEPSLSTLSVIFPSYTSSEEITSSKQRKKISPILKIPRKFSIENNSNYHFWSLKKIIKLSKIERSKEERKLKGREIESVNNPNTSDLQGEEKQKNKSVKTDIHNQETAETKSFECWENRRRQLRTINGSNV
jgi:hypothetical protein